MTVAVTGLLVFVDPSTVIIKEAAGGGEVDPPIAVLRDSELLDTLRGRREYSEEQLQRIVDAAVRPSTWSQLGTDEWSLTESPPSLHLTREFEALELEVGPRLELPRGQVRVVRDRTPVPRHPGYGPSRAPRGRESASRNRRRRPKTPLRERLLTGVVAPVVGFLFFGWVMQQVLVNWIASR